jgi:uncharacterized protein YbjT (DUF2867 family)
VNVFVTGGTAHHVMGDALRAETFVSAIAPADTVVHLVGTPKPSPAKAAEFRAVDLTSVAATLAAAQSAGVRHVVYVSVAQPAPVMRAYVAARQAAEAALRASGLPATVLRPWSVLGPGHWWPVTLLPLYAVLSAIPSTREGAARLGLVTRQQMVSALVRSVEQPPDGLRIVDVLEIRTARL